ncbi:MAG TPA: hypothetical protein P5040_03400, partial [Smithella sp.]|nr:hypothetical protein [Smithella sp.]
SNKKIIFNPFSKRFLTKKSNDFFVIFLLATARTQKNFFFQINDFPLTTPLSSYMCKPHFEQTGTTKKLFFEHYEYLWIFK